eukprot:365565-Chlamydomonas_euryale.AAC.2
MAHVLLHSAPAPAFIAKNASNTTFRPSTSTSMRTSNLCRLVLRRAGSVEWLIMSMAGMRNSSVPSCVWVSLQKCRAIASKV